jgi:hypothetical protein
MLSLIKEIVLVFDRVEKIHTHFAREKVYAEPINTLFISRNTGHPRLGVADVCW